MSNLEPTLDEIIRNVALYNSSRIYERKLEVESGAFTSLERELAKRLNQSDDWEIYVDGRTLGDVGITGSRADEKLIILKKK